MAAIREEQLNNKLGNSPGRLAMHPMRERERVLPTLLSRGKFDWGVTLGVGAFSRVYFATAQVGVL